MGTESILRRNLGQAPWTGGRVEATQRMAACVQVIGTLQRIPVLDGLLDNDEVLEH